MKQKKQKLLDEKKKLDAEIIESSEALKNAEAAKEKSLQECKKQGTLFSEQDQKLIIEGKPYSDRIKTINKNKEETQNSLKELEAKFNKSGPAAAKIVTLQSKTAQLDLITKETTKLQAETEKKQQVLREQIKQYDKLIRKCSDIHLVLKRGYRG